MSDDNVIEFRPRSNKLPPGARRYSTLADLAELEARLAREKEKDTREKIQMTRACQRSGQRARCCKSTNVNSVPSFHSNPCNPSALTGQRLPKAGKLRGPLAGELGDPFWATRLIEKRYKS